MANIEQELGRVTALAEEILAIQSLHTEKLDRLDARLDSVESKVATHSVIGGGLAAIAIGVAIEYVKAKMV